MAKKHKKMDSNIVNVQVYLNKAGEECVKNLQPAVDLLLEHMQAANTPEEHIPAILMLLVAALQREAKLRRLLSRDRNLPGVTFRCYQKKGKRRR